MIIESLRMKNWSSFYGNHELVFSTDSNANVTIIHGSTGKGKTSITSAFQWLISGNVYSYQQFSGNNSTNIKRKMMMFNQPDFKGSLLNRDAYEDKEFEMAVSMTFSYKNELFTLTRSNKVSGVKNKWTESEVVEDLTLEKISGMKFTEQGTKAQEKINQMMPQRLLNFFIIEGDFITKYTEVLFSTDANIDMTKSVEDAIGINAIRKVSGVLESLIQANTDETNVALANLQKAVSKENTAEQYNKIIEQNRIEIARLDTEINTIQKEKKQVETQLKEFAEISGLFEKRDEIERKIEDIEKDIPLKHDSLRENISKVSISIVSPMIAKLDSEYDYDKSEKIEANITSISQQLIKGMEEHTHCTECKQKLPTKKEKLSDEELNKLEERKDILMKENKILKAKARNLRKANEQKIDTLGIVALKTISEKHKDLHIQKRKMESELIEISNILSGKEGFKDTYTKLVGSHTKIEGKLDKKEREKKWIKKGYGAEFDGKVNKNSIIHLRKKLESLGNTGKLVKGAEEVADRYDSYQAILKSIQKVFSESEHEYLSNQHGIVDEMMTETFRKMITDETELITHHRLITTPEWAVEAKTSTDSAQPVENPGTQRKATLAYLEALRKCSKTVFPVIFDNAQTSLESEAKEELANHFIGGSEGQMFILTHSGGYEIDDLHKKYGEFIGRTYLLKSEVSPSDSKRSRTRAELMEMN